jgi:hypothetical protein
MASKKKTELPVKYDYGADSGAGFENQTQDDYQIPFLNQLQALSPEISGGKDEKLAGAEIGMFVNSVSKKLYGEVVLVPCMTKHTFVEWRPREQGGGFVAEHAIDSPIVAEAKAAAAGDITKLKTEKGNDLIDTFSIFAVLIDEPFAEQPDDMVVISFAKTKAKRYREIMTRLRTCKDAKNAPIFAHQLRMTSTDEVNAAKQPYKNVKLTPAVENDVLKSMLPPGNPILEAARALNESVKSGVAKANFDSAQEAPAGSGDEHF